jgi:DNA-3-methyladenine glycosylase II
MWTEEVTLTTPYQWEEVLKRLEHEPTFTVHSAEKRLSIPLFIDDIQAIVKVKQINDDPVCFEVVSEHANKEKILEELSTILQWQTKFDELHQHLRQTTISPLIDLFGHTPITVSNDPFACLITCIIHQQIQRTFAIQVTKRFVRMYGERIGNAWFFPSPERIATLTIDELRDIQLSTRKAEYMIGIAKAWNEGVLSHEHYRTLPSEEIAKELIKLKGVGPWTVENFLLFGLGRKDIFPVGDVGIQIALQKLLNLDEKPSKEIMEYVKEQVSPFGSYAALYLWKSIE